MHILRLSYIFLPRHLQNCFTFCFIFPQDHNFKQETLIIMWITELFCFKNKTNYRIGELEKMNDLSTITYQIS
ncbi:hypothetical protein KFK09_007279 [Dendrobium nobile]|uniref:Uncharacterized protein n=1 Tax=Dendrobium nobile TaxID=94219 RepID=A0A8T3BRN0_DENNO|nr:hypothetical protein KFK09_007279 [Dendrobium nobile]